jgi:hypothetical protein
VRQAAVPLLSRIKRSVAALEERNTETTSV